jgi:glycosyltransferase involved in cell wall biosynthesis
MDLQPALSPSRPSSVAVVMATFNRAHLISESIESILNQTRPPDEFIIVNDGSSDDTANVVRRYGRKIKYVEKTNGGKSSALNLALPIVESAYTWIFDDDDIALPLALESHLKFLSDHPQCDFTYSRHYLFSGDFSNAALGTGAPIEFPPTNNRNYFLWLMELSFLPCMMQGMLVPTRCYRVLGGFDEALLRGQDWDMILRIACRFRAGFLDQPTFALRSHGGDRGPAFQRHAEGDRERVWQQYERLMFEKLYASVALCEYLPEPTGAPLESRTERPLSATEARHALLRRAMIMAIHGLFPMAADDYLAYTDLLGSGPSGLNETERRQISMMAYVQNPQRVPPPKYYRCLGALSRGRRDLFKAAARGLHWSIARELRRRRFVVAFHLVGRGANLAFAYACKPTIGRRQRHPCEFT